MKRHGRKDYFIALVWGLVIPVFGFIILFYLFRLAENFGFIEETTQGISTRRLRTISLLALCSNIIPLRLENKKRNIQWIRGIVSATLLFALGWVIYFRDSLFQA